MLHKDVDIAIFTNTNKWFQCGIAPIHMTNIHEVSRNRGKCIASNNETNEIKVIIRFLTKPLRKSFQNRQYIYFTS